MNYLHWWEHLDDLTRGWLITHNGEALPPGIVAEIAAAGGDVGSPSWWVSDSSHEGFMLSDAAIDWIEAVANGESSSKG